MTTVHKFPLELADRQELKLPRGASILSVQEQGGVLCAWVLLEPERHTETRCLIIVGTGQPVPDDAGPHVASVQTARGAFVWHIFEAVRF